MSVGTLIRAIRESRDLSQTELAALAGISQPNLSAYEHCARTPSVRTLCNIAESCGYELAVTDGRTTIPIPPEEDDGVYRTRESPAVPMNASPEARGRALIEALDLAELIAKSR